MATWRFHRATLLACVAGLASAAQPPLVSAQDVRVIIEVNNSAALEDDYFCWTPIPARARLSDPLPSSQDPVSVTLQAESEAGGGDLTFQAATGARPTKASFTPTPTLQLSLPASGDWTPFWVAGTRPSMAAKDVAIVTKDQAGSELGRLPVMVRVRKDAATLQPEEIRLFLKALRDLHDLDNGAVNSRYTKYAAAHAVAFDVGIHDGDTPTWWPLFLAWHRAFLLSLERELQALEPRVALPYWRFDRRDPAVVTAVTPKIFTPAFMGSVQGDSGVPGGFLVQFDPTNPLFGWQIPELNGALVRQFDATGGAMPDSRLRDLFDAVDGDGNLVNGAYRAINGRLELRYHNEAHGAVNGWLGQGFSPVDPLFFLLHANVDRAWANWQIEFDRWDPGTGDAYHAQGAYPGPGTEPRFRKGSYGDDVMWPWGDNSGDQGTPDQSDDWPDIGVPFALLAGPGTGGPNDPATPKDMVDYLDTRGQGVAINACYDDMDYVGNQH